MTTDRLQMQRLLSPRSIAIIGASPKSDTPGFDTIQQLHRIGYQGDILPVNPKYDEIAGHLCTPDLSSISSAPDHAIIAVNNNLVEQSVRQAGEAGVKAVTVFASCYLENDTEPKLVSRLEKIAAHYRMEICGANCLGFYNFADKVAASWFPMEELRSGPVAFVAHSGAVFASLLGLDRQLGFSLAVSAGQELTTTVSDYLDYALDMESTRVAALFLETIRDPKGFVAALTKARERNVPVVAIKVGRTRQSALLAESHSGAIAGNDAAYQALFNQHGVIRVRDVDEMAATVSLLAAPKKYVQGGLAAITDSGGARGLLIDLADDEKVPFAKISDKTESKLQARLDYGLEPVNPLDAWGTGRGYQGIYRDCLSALMDDADTGIGMFLTDISLEDHLSAGFADVCIECANSSDKPIFVATNYAKMPRTALADKLRDAGIPVIDGVSQALRAVQNVMRYREATQRCDDTVTSLASPETVSRWRERLSQAADGAPIDEAEGYAMLNDWGISTLKHRSVTGAQDLNAAMSDLSLPVVLKTAAPGIAHKSDVGGVVVGLNEKPDVQIAYTEMSKRLGPRAVVIEMAPKGVELVVGGLVDPLFGPFVMIGAGGVLVELMNDVTFIMAPAGRDAVTAALNGLKTAPLLDGLRGGEPVNRDALIDSIIKFSNLMADLSPELSGVEINPLLATQNGSLPLDVLVTPKTPK